MVVRISTRNRRLRECCAVADEEISEGVARSPSVRDQAQKCMQRLWRMRVARIANKVVFERLGKVGQRRDRKADKTIGLQNSGYSFAIVHVMFIQRVRKWIFVG